MATLDPRIALAVQVPQVTTQPLSATQLLGQGLSLQDMMLRGQMTQLQLEQAREQWRQQQALNQLIQQAYQTPAAQTTTASAVPAAPATTPAPAPLTPVPLPTGQPFATPTIPQPTGTLADIMNAPPPAPAPAPATAQAAAPVAGRPTGEIQMPQEAHTPDFQAWMKAAPMVAPQAIENYVKVVKGQYDLANAQFTQKENTLKRAAGLANGIVDEPTKFQAVATAYNEGLVSAPERDRLMQVPFNDPIWKSWQQAAMTGAEGAANARAELEEHRKQLEENRKQALFPSELSEKQAQAATAATKAQQDQMAADAQALAAAAGQGPAQLEAARQQLGPERAAPFAGLTTSRDILNRALTPEQLTTTTETRIQHKIENLRENQTAEQNRQKFNLEYGPGSVDSLVEQVYRNPDTADKLVSQTMRPAVQAAFQKKYGIPYPEPLVGDQKSRETADKSTVTAANTILRNLDDPEVNANFGLIMGKLRDLQLKYGTKLDLSPAAAQKAAETRTAMRLLLAQEPGELGARLSKSTMDALQTGLLKPDINIDLLKGALQGVKNTGLQRLDAFDESRFGAGHARSRAVRGLEPTAEQQQTILGDKRGAGVYNGNDGSRWYRTKDGQVIPF